MLTAPQRRSLLLEYKDLELAEGGRVPRVENDRAMREKFRQRVADGF
jgi:hypothetical protein